MNVELSIAKNHQRIEYSRKIQQNVSKNKKTPAYKLYEFWPGTNRFCCCGLLMTGPSADICQNIYTWTSIIGVCVPYLTLVGPIIYKEVHPAIPIINALLFFFTLMFLFLTGYTEPGIIPRKEIFELNGGVPIEYCPPAGHEDYGNDQQDTEAQNKKKRRNSTHYNSVDDIYSCRIWRPPRASHCSECDNCVEVMDHHCPFVNNCVAKRNYKYFMGFVSCLCVLVLSLVIGFISWGISAGTNKEEDKDSSSVDDNLWIYIVGIPLGIIALILIGFCIWNIFLIAKGKTTREQLKKKTVIDRGDNDFDWCISQESLFNPRDNISEDEAKSLLSIV